MRPTHLTAKIAGAAAVVVLGGSAAAAAADSLPAPAQNAAAHVLSVVGISVPNGHGPNGHSNGHANGNDSGNPGNGPSSNSLWGRCNAASHNGGHPGKATVFPSSTVCSTVVKPGSTSDQSTETSEPQGSADENEGPPTSTPASGTAPVKTPDDGSASSTSTTEAVGEHTSTTVSGHAVNGR